MSENLYLLSEQGITVLADKITEEIKKSLKLETKQQQVQNSESYVGVLEIATFLNLSKQTIYGKVNRGELPYHKNGSKLYFLISEIKSWLNSNKRSNKSINTELDQFLTKKQKK